MTEATSTQLADTQDMKRIHRVFRDAFAAALPLIGSVDPGDPARAELVASYYDNVLRLLESHHEGEDELLTPRLVERCTEPEAAEVRRVAVQHQAVTTGIQAAEVAIANWRAVPNVESASTAVTAIASLNLALCEHLDEEEAIVLPIAGRHITQAEWDELPAHGFAHFTGDKVWLVLGLIQEQQTPEQVSAMEAAMPPPVAAFWQQQGRPLFLEYVATLRR